MNRFCIFLIDIVIGAIAISLIVGAAAGIIALFRAFGGWVIIGALGLIVCYLMGWMIRAIFDIDYSLDEEESEDGDDDSYDYHAYGYD